MASTPTLRSGLLPVGPPGLGRRELVLLGVVLAVGAALRASALWHSAVEHFDEGVYASNLYFGPPDYAYPLQRFYAPPLVPALIETGMICGLPANLAALLPSFFAGCGTTAALWWFGRSWFGPRAGIAVATLVALSPFAILFSAAALTDALLGLWLVLAVDAAARSLVVGTLRVPLAGDGTRSVPTTYGDLRWAVGAGLFTGLAWWTKYNGWLPLAIEAATLPLLWLFVRPPRKQLTAWLGCFAVTALVAAAVWSPYFIELQSHGGYAPIAENHAKYVVGLSGWFDSASRQAANFFVIDGGWTGAAIVAAVALAVMTPAGQTEQGDARSLRQKFGVALMGAWWLGLLIATPCYWPYPRLLLPWLLATWLAAAIVFDLLLRQRRERLISGLVSALAIAAALAGLGWLWASRSDATAGDRRALLSIAAKLRSDLDTVAPPPATATSPPTRALYVFGEPAMYFQLAAAGEPIVTPAREIALTNVTLEGKSLPTFLVAGPHADRDPKFREQLAAAGNRWRHVQTYPYAPSGLVWLDLHDPRMPAAEQAASGHAFRLYELQP
jgi:dolichyl-phosphate-mannose-protein mannosyltransferase